ncbi:MAG: peptidyl-prolyl cis-trans isomerase [candidate division KSB1 bacterium]|nr:peptidyl-prolyl cis-trans isomerase [candidate division KSB1 bacterium]
MYMKPTVIMIGMLLAFWGLNACQKTEKPRSPIVVKVGDEALTLDDLKYTIPEELHGKITREELQEYVSRWINAHILYQEGLKLGLGDKIDIKRRIHEFEVGIIGNAYLETVLEVHPLVSDSAVAAYYEKNKEDFVRRSLEYRLWHILVKTRKTADSVRTLLRRGQPFDSLAMHFAKNQPKGVSWDLGYVSEDELIPEIASKLKVYRVGAFTRPIKTNFGYHIFKIIDKKDRGTLKPLVDVREAIIARIEQDLREEKYRQILGELKSKAHIETNFQLLNRISLDSLFAKSNPLNQSK